MQATPDEFLPATCAITIDGGCIYRWRKIRRTHDLYNPPTWARWPNFMTSVVCIATMSGWPHETGRLSAQATLRIFGKHRLQIGQQTLIILQRQRCKKMVLPGRMLCEYRTLPVYGREARLRIRLKRISS